MCVKHLNTPLVEAEKFSFGYEEDMLLKDLQFALEKEEFILVAGASGSGKSTLALCLNGLYPEAVEGTKKGAVRIHGRKTEDYEKGELSQRIGVVFQDPESQFCMMKVEDELAFVLENQKVPSEEMEQKIDRVLLETGLSEQKHRLIHELSGGQKQKIALASVLLMEPDLLILDEPTANLDPVSSLEFAELAAAVQRERRCAVMVIEHQPDDWMPFIKRVLLLGKDGRMKADGSPDQIYLQQKDLLIQEGVYLPQTFRRPESPLLLPESREEEIIRVENLSYSRKDRTILTDVNFSMRAGEFAAVTGENGTGKSTLLQLMARLLEPESGKVLFAGKNINDWEEGELRKRSGYVFQNPEHQFITDTVFEELAFGPELNGKRDAEAHVHRLLKTFHLTEQREASPFSLSGGQKRRLSVATMLEETPDILFFDEPTFGQDARTTEELMKIVLELRRKGTAIVFVTHDMDLVDKYCEKVLVLTEGTAVFNGKPETLWTEDELLARARLRLPHRIREREVYRVVD
ncbi:ABC transporter ATP-binding protein [Alkalicoccus saliphilus]|uniref:ABC transporter ATP-binding protein n=1 Tax=Alkalicoccus saliphilus TaxID=200989 RepID=A0A2T4U766_9BACI|nr:ABC transporter ATP-binding protein [Alkalicoccus saliphilus]